MTTLEEKTFLLLLGGAIGLTSSVVTLLIKSLFDFVKERRALRREQDVLLTYQEMDNRLPDGHPLLDLVHIRDRLKQSSPDLKADPDKTLDWIRLYTEVNDKILQWSDQESRRMERILEIEVTLGKKKPKKGEK